MFGEFDKKRFASLLQQALGDRSAYRYSKEVNLSRNHISLLLRQEAKTVPSPDTIRKLAEKAANGITYEDFMIAAGHLPHPDQVDKANDLTLILNDIKSPDTEIMQTAALLDDKAKEEFADLCTSVVSFLKDNEVSKEELQECLIMLRALKKAKNTQE